MWMFACLLTIFGPCECWCVRRSDHADWDCNFVTYVKMSMNLTLALVKIASFNTRGLGDKIKRLELFSWLEMKYCTLIFLQETHTYRILKYGDQSGLVQCTLHMVQVNLREYVSYSKNCNLLMYIKYVQILMVDTLKLTLRSIDSGLLCAMYMVQIMITLNFMWWL